MAPEIYENWRFERGTADGTTYDYSADIFSLTIVVWECLTRQQPYAATTDESTGRPLKGIHLCDCITNGLRPSSGRIFDGSGSFVSPDIQALVEAGWHQSPACRPTATALRRGVLDDINAADQSTFALNVVATPNGQNTCKGKPDGETCAVMHI